MPDSGPSEHVDPRTLDIEFGIVSEVVGVDESDAAWDALCRFVLQREGQDGRWEVTLALVDDGALREMHARFMGLDSVTDVMTFPADENLVHGGDIVISFDRAAAQGPEHGLTTTQEIRFLFVHGLLHLCGWEDGSPEQRDEMLRRQSGLLELFAET
jgi:probable rRNA maturation factor